MSTRLTPEDARSALLYFFKWEMIFFFNELPLILADLIVVMRETRQETFGPYPVMDYWLPNSYREDIFLLSDCHDGAQGVEVTCCPQHEAFICLVLSLFAHYDFSSIYAYVYNVLFIHYFILRD